MVYQPAARLLFPYFLRLNLKTACLGRFTLWAASIIDLLKSDLTWMPKTSGPNVS